MCSACIGLSLKYQRRGQDFFTARKRSLRRLCFYTCLCVHKGGAVPGQVPPGRYTPRQVHPRAGTPTNRYLPWAGTPSGRYLPRHSTCWDMVNKRVVRIPLECILVYIIFSLVSTLDAKLYQPLAPTGILELFWSVAGETLQ